MIPRPAAGLLLAALTVSGPALRPGGGAGKWARAGRHSGQVESAALGESSRSLGWFEVRLLARAEEEQGQRRQLSPPGFKVWKLKRMPAGVAGRSQFGRHPLAGIRQSLLSPAQDHTDDAIHQARRGDKHDDEQRLGSGFRQDGGLVRIWWLYQPFLGFRHVIPFPRAGTG